jgi:hypothetical protein
MATRSATSLPPPALPPAVRPNARRLLAPAPVGWATVTVLAVLMAYGDGFVLTSLEGAVGAIERVQGPFATWLTTSTLMVPVFLLAVLAALAFARSRLGSALHTARKVLVAGLLIAAAGGVVGTTEVAITLAYDYHLQSELLESGAMLHDHAVAGAPVADATTCTGTCAAREAQFTVATRAARLGSAAAVGVDLVLVGWVLAARGGRLESRRAERARRPGRDGRAPALPSGSPVAAG